MSGQRLLVQVRCSDSDVAYINIVVSGENEGPVSFRDNIDNLGVRMLKQDLVDSCQGNIDFAVEYARQIAGLTEGGDRVAACISGGLFWAFCWTGAEKY
jgi:hypothetical protein